MPAVKSSVIPAPEIDHALPPAAAAGASTPAGWLAHPAVLLAALLALLAVARLGQTINNDVAWYIHSAAALLDGGRLYDDIFFEVNPPLMLYLTLPGALLARLTGWFAADAYLLTVFAAIALALGLSCRVLADRPPAERRTILLAAGLVLGLLPAGDFGQRSHVMLVLTLPYLLLLARRLAAGPPCGRWLALAIGAAAGLGCAIKPHYLLLPAALEALLLARAGRPARLLRPETLAIAAVVALYGLSIPLLTPDYLTRVVPYALEVYNLAYHNSPGIVLARPEMLLAPLACLVHWHWRRRMPPRQAAAGDVLGLAALVMLAIYLVQMKGWNYHIYPTTALLVLLAVGVLAAAVDRPGALRAGAFAAACLLLAKAALLTGNRYPLMERLLPVVRAHAAGGSIGFLATTTWTGFPLALYADVGWASRFPALWLLPGLAQARRGGAPGTDLARLAEIERFTTAAVIADLAAHRPQLVFVDARPRKPWFGDTPFDFIEHFAADPEFAALWAGYERIGAIEGYEIYRRRAPAARALEPPARMPA